MTGDSRAPVMVYGNCQEQFLCHLLGEVASLNGRFSFHVVTVLAEDPEQKVVVPDEASRAVLVLEQHDQRPSVSLRDALLARVPTECRRLRYPPVMLYAFRPFWMKDPRKVPESGRDAACEVKMSDFIFSRLQSRYQFLTHGHLSSDVYAELLLGVVSSARDVFGAIDEALLSELRGVAAAAPQQGDLQIPIHPLVIERLGLGFVDETTSYDWFGNAWTFEDFTKRLIAFDRSWQR